MSVPNEASDYVRRNPDSLLLYTEESYMSDETTVENVDQEFEEICSDEVDRVVEILDGLIENVQSENIKHFLEEASSNIYYLVYEDAEDEGTLEQAA
ncbi:MAG: hypothetical protein WAO83_26625 [Fuerstiella sp.]